MTPALCEDVLDRVLRHLCKLQISGWNPSQHFIVDFMLVGRNWLEVGRRHLYKDPAFYASPDAVTLFVASLLYHNPDLGGYVRTFSATGIHLGPVVLSRLIALMPKLQTLQAENLEFVNHFPANNSIPQLSMLQVLGSQSSSSTPDPSKALPRRDLMLVDVSNLQWMLNAHEVHFRCLHICARSPVICSEGEGNLRKLVLDRCTWDSNTCAELIPQLSSRIDHLQIENFGITQEQRTNGNEGWGNSSSATSSITPRLEDVLLPSFYGLARRVRHLKLAYPPGAIVAALPDLSLLTGDIVTCDVNHQDAERSDEKTHCYPSMTKKLVVKVNGLYRSLLRFVKELQKPEYLSKLEEYPEIWIKATRSHSASAWGEPANPPVMLANSDLWLASRQAAVVALTQRGLQPPCVSPHLEVSPSGFGWGTVKYTSFWAWDFTVANPTGTQDDFADPEGGVW